MDYSTSSLRNSIIQPTDRNKFTVMPTSSNENEYNFSANTSDMNSNSMGRLADVFLNAITGSSIAMANDSDQNIAAVPTAPTTSRYTGNTCNSDGAIKSIAENGLAVGVGGAVLDAVKGLIVGGPFGAVIGSVVDGAAAGMITGTVSGGTFHQLGCN